MLEKKNFHFCNHYKCRGHPKDECIAFHPNKHKKFTTKKQKHKEILIHDSVIARISHEKLFYINNKIKKDLMTIIYDTPTPLVVHI